MCGCLKVITNLGFAAGNNIWPCARHWIDAGRLTIVLLLNNDAILAEDGLSQLLDTAEQYKAVLLARFCATHRRLWRCNLPAGATWAWHH